MERIQRPEAQGFLVPRERTFVPETLNALLGIEKPTEIEARALDEARSLGLGKKDEFHASVIASRNGKILKKALADSPDKDALADLIRREFESREWRYRLLPEYCLMEKFYDRAELDKSGYGTEIPEQKRQTLIQKIELPDLAGFYAAINQATGLELPSPFPHITLFSGSDYAPMAQRGIGIYSKKDFHDSLKKQL